MCSHPCTGHSYRGHGAHVLQGKAFLEIKFGGRREITWVFQWGASPASVSAKREPDWRSPQGNLSLCAVCWPETQVPLLLKTHKVLLKTAGASVWSLYFTPCSSTKKHTAKGPFPVSVSKNLLQLGPWMYSLDADKMPQEQLLSHGLRVVPLSIASVSSAQPGATACLLTWPSGENRLQP